MPVTEFVNKVENRRQEKLQKLKIATYVAIAFGILGILFIIFAFCFEEARNILLLIGIIVIIVGIIIYGIGYSLCNASFVRTFKDELDDQAIRQNYENFEYSASNGLTLETIMASGICYSPDRYSSKGFFKAIKGKVDFISCDYTFEYEHQTTDSKGNTKTYYNSYNGKFIRFEVQRNNQAYVSIIENRSGSEMFKNPRNGEKIEFESMDFNKKFICHANDPYKANYLITPIVQVNLLDFDNAFNSQIKIVIDGNYVYCFLASYQTKLRLGIYKKFDEQSFVKHANEFLVPYLLADALDLEKDKYTERNL